MINVNVEEFFKLYNSDQALRARVQEAEDNYPGCLELREALVENVLLPIAADLGLPFTVKELRAYETRLKMSRVNDQPIDPDEPDDDTVFWLIDHGWTDDEAKFCSD